MLIELHGAGFINKGAQLMLETVIERLPQYLPSVNFCLETKRRLAPDELRRLQIKTILLRVPRRYTRTAYYGSLLRASDFLGRFVPASVYRKENAVARHEINALIDIAGYAYGDVWPTEYARIMLTRAKYYAARGKPVIFLPQMFGPFENPDLQHTMRQLYDAASLVYARDQLSYSFAKNLIDGSADKLRLAPDITIFVQPDSSTPLPEQPYACVVPNMRVLDRGSAEWQRTYMAELRQTIQLLRSHKLRVILVEHEKTGDDRRLIDELFAEFGGDSVQICDDPSPRRLKAVLGGARLVVASRFHAAVGALSSGTPTIVLGWAHKYNALMADFGAGDFVHDATDKWPHLEGLLLQLIDDQLRSAHQKILRERKEAMRPANDAMWDEAVKLIATA